jgi:arsenate reductase
MDTFIIIHNPRCSKSRETLALLESRGITPKVVDYLNGELNRELLLTVIKALNISPKEILRTKEEEFQSLTINLDDSEEVINAILKHPKLLERPIVLHGHKAAIGRPPENILGLLTR